METFDEFAAYSQHEMNKHYSLLQRFVLSEILFAISCNLLISNVISFEADLRTLRAIRIHPAFQTSGQSQMLSKLLSGRQGHFLGSVLPASTPGIETIDF